MRWAQLVAVALLACAAPAAAADIVVFGVSPSTPPPGTAVTLTFELRNPERRPLPTGVVDVRAAGRSIGHIATPAVPAGGSVKVTGGVTLPNVTDKTLRLDLVPFSGPPASVVLTLTPRHAGDPSPVAPPVPAPAERGRGGTDAGASGTGLARSRELAGPNFVGTPAP